MEEYTEEQVEEMVQEAIAKTEKSFGGTFKRLKSENEELKTKHEAVAAEYETARNDMQKRIEEFENLLSESKKHISELAIRGELQRQLRGKSPMPERFVDVGSIEYSDDPDTLSASVVEAVDNGQKELEQALGTIGIAVSQVSQPQGNPTNPPNRDTKTARDLKKSEARDALQDMTRRGLLRFGEQKYLS